MPTQSSHTAPKATAHAGALTETQDSLQAALAFFVRYYRLTHTLTSLTVGLPLKDGRLTPALFGRAATRAGLVTRVARRKLADLSAHVLPAVVIQAPAHGGRALVLRGLKDGKAVTYDPLVGKEAEWDSVAALEKTLSGYVILVKMGLRLEMTQESRNPLRRWFWGVLEQFKPLYGKVFMAAAVINVLALAASLFAMNVYDRVVPNAAYETLWVLAIGVVVAYLFDFVFRQLRAYFVDVAGKGADILLASRVYSQLLNLRLGNQQSSAGAFANQLREYETVREFFTSGTVTALVDVPFMFLFVFVIFLLGGPLALIPLVALPLVIAVSWAVQAPVRDLIAEVTREMDMKHGHLIESINGLENIKAIGSQGHAQGRWEQLTGVSARMGMKTRFLSNLGVHFSVLLPNLAYAAMVVWGAYRIINGDMTMGALVACSMLLSRALAPVGQIAGLFLRYTQVRVSLDALTKLMLSPVERPVGKEFVHVKQLEGGIRFDNVSFAYPGTRLNSLESVSFTIKPGEKVGIIGRAGSGKSTIARLLLGLYEPTEGGILLDGLDSRQLDPADVRKSACYFPQNLYLFRGTLRENLLLANPNARDDLLVQAVEVSGAYRLIRRHPMGFDLPVGERGETLSGGQRQAVGLARALMHDGSIAIFDDPTSEMDATSETWVKDRLKKWLKDRTLLLITHRPAMLDLVDRLLVIDDGRLIADGPKAKILEMLSKGVIKGRE